MLVVICYLNAVRCIWTNFFDVVSIIRGWLLSPKQLQLADLLMKDFFGFAGIMLLIFIEVLGLTEHERWIR